VHWSLLSDYVFWILVHTSWLITDVQNLSYPPPEDVPTQESVHLLRRKIMESKRLGRYLRAEASRNEAIIAQLKDLTTLEDAPESAKPSRTKEHDFSFLTSTTSAKALNVTTTTAGFAQPPVTTNTKFALSQLPALQSLLADLRPRLASLQSSNTGIDGVRAERREERREYIEQRAKLHLDRHGDGASASHSAVSGKRVEPEEIEALEKVANILDTH
jgi:kinetochore protein Mis12/MTW1